MELIGKITVWTAALIVNAIIRGAVLVALWGWYVERLGVPSINIAEAIGLAMTLGLLTQRGGDPNDKRTANEKLAVGMTESVFGAGFVLLFGWIVHFFI